MASPVSKFDTARAEEYAVQSRIALAGYDACHELAACLLSAILGPKGKARILVIGAGGTAREIVIAGRLEPNWHFTAIDPSPPMVAAAKAAVEAEGFAPRVAFHLGLIEDLPEAALFDAATLVGVLHHLPTVESKRTILAGIASRLKPGAPFVLACNRGFYAAHPLFLKAWGTRWRMAGESADVAEAKLGKILEGADPPASDNEVALLLGDVGFAKPDLFFSSLFWGGWITRSQAQAS
jgi:tRNA (cmo5U34)-methyltransferase